MAHNSWISISCYSSSLKVQSFVAPYNEHNICYITAVVIIEELLNRNVGSIYVTDVHQKRIEDVTDMFSSQV